jgi:CheY-like chemotaxis protein/predicted transcriptional regulator
MSTRRHDVSKRGSGADAVALSEVMNRDVICVRQEMSIVALADLMLTRDLTSAPVVDARGRVVGMVTCTDLARATWDPQVIAHARTVADIMMNYPFTLSSSASLARAAALMAYEGVHRVVVVEPSGSVAGIVSGADVMRWLARKEGFVVPGYTQHGREEHTGPHPTSNLIMIVDDDTTIRDELAELLREEGYGVVTAANGRDALTVLRAGERPSVILLDLAMPIMDGRSFATELRKDPDLIELPVVLLSAQGNAREVAARVEAQACLVKPVPYVTLLDTVERFCA